MYAIGGSADPTIFSEGNYFIASDKSNSKEVLYCILLVIYTCTYKLGAKSDLITI